MNTMHISRRETPPIIDSATTALRGRPLVLARVAWLALALLTAGLIFASIPFGYARLLTICTREPCPPAQMTLANLQALHASGLSAGSYAAYMSVLQFSLVAAFWAVAAVLFWRKSTDWLILLGALMLLTLPSTFLPTMAAMALAQPLAAVPVYVIQLLASVAFFLFFCLFPDGRFVPRWIWIVTIIWALSRLPMTAPGWMVPPEEIGLFVCLGVLIAAQIYRYRRVATPVQHQQIKWVIFGFVSAIGGALALSVPADIFGWWDQTGSFANLATWTCFYALLLLIPLSLAMAILRSHLWEIDVVIKRALVYGMLTGALALIYFGSVIGMQALAREAPGQALAGQTAQSPLVVVVSTLLVAALFQPLRRRIQTAIDRRFYRRKYDAAKTLAAFGATLRSEVDLDQLSRHLLTVVEETMHPASISLWLRQR